MKKTIYITILVLTVLCNQAKAQQANNGPETKKIINITNITAYAKDSKLVIEWATDGNSETNYWEVQRGTEDGSFSTIAIVLGADPAQAGDRYQYVEKLKDSKSQNLQYRICHVGKDGSLQYSVSIQQAKK
jgi:hypothetical protein